MQRVATCSVSRVAWVRLDRQRNRARYKGAAVVWVVAEEAGKEGEEEGERKREKKQARTLPQTSFAGKKQERVFGDVVQVRVPGCCAIRSDPE